MKRKKDIHIGIATLVMVLVSVIRHADKLTLSDLGRTIKEEAEQARKKRLWIHPCIPGSTFSITNLGAQGIECYTDFECTWSCYLRCWAIQKALTLDENGQ